MMKLKTSKIHFPTALGLLILLVAIGVGVFLVKTRTNVESEAEETMVPKQVHITNVADTSFSVSWITDQVASGQVNYGVEANSLKQEALDDRDQLSGESGKFEVHHVTVKNLKPQTDYYFKLASGGRQFDNNGKPFEVATGSTLGSPPAADPVYGTVLTASGVGAEGVVVYLNLANAAPLSALVKTNGNWALSLSTARNKDLSGYLSYDTQATLVNLLVQGGKQGVANVVTTTANDSPVPDVTLGQSYDFRTVAGSEETIGGSTRSPGSSSSEEEDEVSGFSLESLQGSQAASQSGEVTLENPSFEGEVLNATMPAFLGAGPPGTVLSIEINSENNYTGSAVIDEDGNWEFTPPEGLEEGEHEITITYIDSEGLEQTLSRMFVVAAAGESENPAITATPSGGTTGSGAARTSLPATDSGVPEPGGWETTLMLLIMGMGLLAGGLGVKLKVRS